MRTREDWTRAYLETARNEHSTEDFDTILARIGRVAQIPAGARILEVGVGTGWLLRRLGELGYVCEGVEYNEMIRDHAAAATGVPIHLGSIETVNLPSSAFDVVLAESVFEHVPDHREGFRNIHRALKPGGVLHFTSTNKFARKSGEFEGVPLYGWYPRAIRWRIRTRSERSGVNAESAFFDWHQFTHQGLRRDFRRAGFARVYDRFELIRADEKTGAKRAVISAYKHVPPLKELVALFAGGTEFVCVK